MNTATLPKTASPPARGLLAQHFSSVAAFDAAAAWQLNDRTIATRAQPTPPTLAAAPTRLRSKTSRA